MSKTKAIDSTQFSKPFDIHGFGKGDRKEELPSIPNDSKLTESKHFGTSSKPDLRINKEKLRNSSLDEREEARGEKVSVGIGGFSRNKLPILKSQLDETGGPDLSSSKKTLKTRPVIALSSPLRKSVDSEFKGSKHFQAGPTVYSRAFWTSSK